MSLRLLSVIVLLLVVVSTSSVVAQHAHSHAHAQTHSYAHAHKHMHQHITPQQKRDIVTDLPGLLFTPTFQQYAGYINVPGKPDMLHYWFIEALDSPQDKPVMLWLNGGPGCSSSMATVFEHGPFIVQSNLSLAFNEYTWCNYANIIYLDSPSGVGYSYGSSDNYTSGDTSTAQDNYAFLQGWMAAFPQYATNLFIIAGESYAGNYVTTLVDVILQQNEIIRQRSATPDPHATNHNDNDNNNNNNNDNDSLPIDLFGIMLGNPTMDFSDMTTYYVPAMLQHGAITPEQYSNASSLCNGSFRPPQSSQCKAAVSDLQTQVFGINPYNVYAMCSGSQGFGTSFGCFTDMDMDAESAADDIIQAQSHSSSSSSSFRSLFSTQSHTRGQTFVPCIDVSSMRDYFNQPAVWDALHVNVDAFIQPWDVCSQVLKYTQLEPSVLYIYDEILHKTNMRVMVFSGDVDSCVATLSSYYSVLAIPWVSNATVRDPWQSWHYTDSNGWPQIGGKFIQWQEQLAFVTVRGAGHLASNNVIGQPQAVAQLLNSFINSPTGESMIPKHTRHS